MGIFYNDYFENEKLPDFYIMISIIYSIISTLKKLPNLYNVINGSYYVVTIFEKLQACIKWLILYIL